DYAGAVSADTEAYAEYFGYMLENGIYVAPSQFEAMFVSASHSDDDIKRTCDIISNFKQYKKRRN
ncbi:MAG: aspartate aminotransferase family protein, partial [Acutalibacteraceae bacterium]|nr:aspartate aminotransferase family protein [Acutalibacteraceae bacterium]